MGSRSSLLLKLPFLKDWRSSAFEQLEVLAVVDSCSMILMIHSRHSLVCMVVIQRIQAIILHGMWSIWSEQCHQSSGGGERFQHGGRWLVGLQNAAIWQHMKNQEVILIPLLILYPSFSLVHCCLSSLLCANSLFPLLIWTEWKLQNSAVIPFIKKFPLYQHEIDPFKLQGGFRRVAMLVCSRRARFKSSNTSGVWQNFQGTRLKVLEIKRYLKQQTLTLKNLYPLVAKVLLDLDKHL